MVVHFPQRDDTIVELCKTHHGRYNHETWSWYFMGHMAASFLSDLRQHPRFSPDPSCLDAALITARHYENVRYAQGRIYVKTEFRNDVYSAMKSLHAWWDMDKKVWVLQATQGIAKRLLDMGLRLAPTAYKIATRCAHVLNVVREEVSGETQQVAKEVYARVMNVFSPSTTRGGCKSLGDLIHA